MPRNSGRTHVMLVDDLLIVRSGIRAMLERLPRFEVTCEASSGLDVCGTLRDHSVDIVLMDVAMPWRDGIDATAELREADEDVPVLMVTGHAEPECVRRALAAGASGFFSKSRSPEELIAAIDAVLAGRPLAERLCR
jgi:DNA-binding NarL/FixJ family response regulator